MALRLNAARPVLVLLNGPPCAGKTHLYAFIQDECVLPAMSKDVLKESPFAALCGSDLNGSRHLNQAAMPILYKFASKQLLLCHTASWENHFAFCKIPFLASACCSAD